MKTFFNQYDSENDYKCLDDYMYMDQCPQLYNYLKDYKNNFRFTNYIYGTLRNMIPYKYIHEINNYFNLDIEIFL